MVALGVGVGVEVASRWETGAGWREKDKAVPKEGGVVEAVAVAVVLCQVGVTVGGGVGRRRRGKSTFLTR